jgi:tRNA-modifying protein YgfZ
MFSEEGYQAVRHGAAAIERTDRGVIRVLGADGTTWLQGLLTNDIETLTPVDGGSVGDARYTAYLTPQGRMITDARVVRLPDHVLLDVPASLSAALVQRLDALIFAEDVRVEDVSATIAVVELHGPDASRVVDALRATTPPAGTVAIVGDDQFGVPGFALFVSAADRAQWESALEAAGAARVDLETLDVVRIEAARPAFLVDMETDTIPLEAGIEDRAISFTKGCYVGQEIIVRVTQRGGGRVARRLVGLELNGSDIPAGGALIRVGDRDVGRITSATVSPTLGHTIALGYVHRDFVEPGTAVTVVSDDTSYEARVTRTPFVA